jgi:hypothetical protein
MMQGDTLLPAMARLAALQQTSIDKTALQEAGAMLAELATTSHEVRLDAVTRLLDLSAPRWLKKFEPAHVPCPGPAAGHLGHCEGHELSWRSCF